MTRRWSLLTAALTLCLPLSVLTTVAPAVGDVASPDPQGLTSCPASTRQAMLFRDDDTPEVQDAIDNEQVQSFDFDYPNTGQWQQSQFDGAPQNPWTGTDSWFGWDPRQNVDITDRGDGRLVSEAPMTVPAASASTFLYFAHSYVFPTNTAASGLPTYPDGARALVQTSSDGGTTWQDTAVPWANGPTRNFAGTTIKVFAGDSHSVSTNPKGYVSSRLDLSSLAGKRVRVVFEVRGTMGDRTAGYGWWVDDVRLFSCVPLASAPALSVAAAATSARLSWGTSSVDAGVTNDNGNTVNGYRVTVNGAVVRNLPAATHTTTLTGLRANTNMTIGVAAVTRDGVGAVRSVPIYATTARVTSVAKAKKNKYFTVTGTLSRRGTTARVAGVRLTLQRHLASQRVWHTVSTATTNTRGVKAWRLKEAGATYYRVVATGIRSWLGTTSAVRGVGIRR